jgi:hypothetical protein
MTQSGWLVVAGALLLVAMIGLQPFVGGCGGEWYIKDPVTGNWRPATAADTADQIQKVGNALQTAAVVTGQPQWVPFVDVFTRLATTIAAVFIGVKYVPAPIVKAIANNTAAPPAGTG